MDSSSFWHLIGGIGLFLLGMGLMTDGLMQSGTRTVRRLMQRITTSRWAGLATGFGVTAVVQSSSATTLITVSFVSAGIVTFQQSIAVMLGANLGTTSTTWIVSLVGLKVSTAAFALPAVGIGALIRLISRGRRQALGLALAGFGLVFLGIDFLQLGMASISEHLRPEDIALDGVLGTLALVGVGLVMTVIMQSSSAAAATTLAAVHAGSISFDQAAALVIGQNIGTTVTAILGALGGTVAARRAAAAHFSFNLLTAILALILLDPFTDLVIAVGDDLFAGTKEAYVALFHTGFNLLGVIVFMPLLSPFARLVTRLVPERGGGATERLSKVTLSAPALALEAARLTAMELGGRALKAADEALRRATHHDDSSGLVTMAARLVREPRRLLTGEGAEHATHEARLRQLDAGLGQLRDFLGRLGPLDPRSPSYQEYLAVLYAADHIQRITHGIALPARLQTLSLDPALEDWVDALLDGAAPLADTLLDRADATTPPPQGEALAEVAAGIDRLRELVAHRRVTYRAALLARTAAGDVSTADTDELLDTNRWLVDLGHSAARICELLMWPQTSARELADPGPAPART